MDWRQQVGVEFQHVLRIAALEDCVEEPAVLRTVEAPCSGNVARIVARGLRHVEIEDDADCSIRYSLCE
jgi:hypothetical protein